MTKWVQLARLEEEDRRTRQETVTVSILLEEESGAEKDKDDDVGAAEEREIWQVTTVTEEDLKTTEGEVVDLYDKLMELAGWKTVDNEKENKLTWLLIKFVEPGLRFCNKRCHSGPWDTKIHV